MRLVLVSKSPRRRQLLSALGYAVDFVDIDVDEHVAPETDIATIAETLAIRKANALDPAQLDAHTVAVAADTVVAHNGRALGKPTSRAEAVAMLTSLSSARHTVYTGVCLRSATEQHSFTEATEVFFRRLTNEEIEYYVDTYSPYDKAGAYGIQEWIGMVGIKRIEGCYYNVMGLPVARLYETLRRMSASM